MFYVLKQSRCYNGFAPHNHSHRLFGHVYRNRSTTSSSHKTALISGSRGLLLFVARRHDLEGAVRQRTLKLMALEWMADDVVRIGGEESEGLGLPLDRVGLCAAVPCHAVIYRRTPRADRSSLVLADAASQFRPEPLPPITVRARGFSEALLERAGVT